MRKKEVASRGTSRHRILLRLSSVRRSASVRRFLRRPVGYFQTARKQRQRPLASRSRSSSGSRATHHAVPFLGWDRKSRVGSPDVGWAWSRRIWGIICDRPSASQSNRSARLPAFQGKRIVFRRHSELLEPFHLVYPPRDLRNSTAPGSRRPLVRRGRPKQA